MSDPQADDRCFCGQTRKWHSQNTTQHQFRMEGEPGGAASLTPKKKDDKNSAPAVVARVPGGDPALRLALINAGVITLSQLMAAEEELQNARETGRPAIADPVARPGASISGSSSAEDP